ncbi:MAG: hypothetical protein K0U93_15495 [Gammaproteobacteria bacterium]|nr:hypothetical protein [Gammaproteobacteria bacterium]
MDRASSKYQLNVEVTLRGYYIFDGVNDVEAEVGAGMFLHPDNEMALLGHLDGIEIRRVANYSKL